MAAVKHLLVDLGRPVTQDELQDRTRLPPEVVTARLEWLEGRGEVRREDDGWVLGE